MEKTILIDGQKIRFKTNGATPLRYKAQFGKDYFKEILKMAPLAKFAGKDLNPADLDALDFDIFFNIAWIMAKTAEPTIPEPMEWLEGFEEFPMIEIFPELQDLMITSLQGTATKKKITSSARTKKQ